MKSEKIIVLQHSDIVSLNISPEECIEWIRDSFNLKQKAQLPPKISVHPVGNDFFTSMPCWIPTGYVGVKEVSRINGRIPALSSEMLLYNSKGVLLAIIDCDWITAMRTGAVAAASIEKLQNPDCYTYSFIGLGNTARATAACLLALNNHRYINFRILSYKDQAELFIERFKKYRSRLEITVVNSVKELVSGAEVLISSITDANGLICDDPACYRPGFVLVPVHTRGFQNCDLFFDRIYGDDLGHIRNFGNFAKFKYFAETAELLNGKDPGRRSEDERIIAYNIGLGLHDVIFASRIYERLKNKDCQTFCLEKENEKFWI